MLETVPGNPETPPPRKWIFDENSERAVDRGKIRG